VTGGPGTQPQGPGRIAQPDVDPVLGRTLVAPLLKPDRRARATAGGVHDKIRRDRLRLPVGPARCDSGDSTPVGRGPQANDVGAFHKGDAGECLYPSAHLTFQEWSADK
jgi:hypothetical protein